MKENKYNLNLYHFFPDKLNLYGDRGNIISLKKRCEWRNIELNVVEVTDPTKVDLNEMDLFFIGGGSDREQSLATVQLLEVKDALKNKIEEGTPGLTICGGYQFLGSEYIDANGEKLQTLEILDFKTKSESPRLIGNVLIKSEKFGEIVGFENHGGRTSHNLESLGNVVKGNGNDDYSKKEGILHKNLIGTYLHGPILPKNPAIADFLIKESLIKKYKNKFNEEDFISLDDALENKARNSVWKKVIETK